MLNTSIGKDYNYAHIISGEDYPTKPAEEIIAAFNGDDKIYCDYDLISGKSTMHIEGIAFTGHTPDFH